MKRPDLSIEDVEVPLLLEGMVRRYGFDFRGYAPASLRRRIKEFQRQQEAPTITRLLERVLHEPPVFEQLVAALTGSSVAMYRDPSFWTTLRREVVPVLRTYPFIRIWLAGSGRGEEVYSLAILLHEEGLYERCRIYATDPSEHSLRRSKAGVFPTSSMQEFTKNYVQAGGAASFSEYYTASGEDAILRHSLKKNLVFAQHNLGSDGSFNEFNLILCRNVMIQYARPLQSRVHDLLHQSLSKFGILALGRREGLQGTPGETRYEALDLDERIYRRVQ